MKWLFLVLLLVIPLAFFAVLHPESWSASPLFRQLIGLEHANDGNMKITWQHSADRLINFGILPYQTDEELAEHFSLLMAFLSRHLGIQVRILVADDYRSLIQLIEAGKVQVAWLGTALLETWKRRDMVEILCHPIQRGRAHYRSAILVRSDSPYHSVEDLGGHRMAYVDRFSGSGFLYPARLLREHGMDPVASFSEVLFSGNHSRSLDALLSGTADAAAIFIDSGDESGIPTGTRCLSWVQWIPTDPIVASRELPAETRARLKDLFINIGQYPGGLETMQHMKARRGYEGFLADEETKN